MNDRLHRIEAGQSHLPTLVLLHGFGGMAESWRPIMDGLAGSAHLLAFDLPGHAGSLSYPNFGSPRVAASAVVNELQLLGLAKVHLAGHSMGGAIAALVTLSNPELVASLTLIAPGGFGSEINADLLQRYARAITPDELTHCLEMMCGHVADASRTLPSTMADMRARPHQREALELIFAKITRDGKQGILPLEALSAMPILKRLVWGKLDAVVPVEHAYAAPSTFHKTILPNAGHMLVEEAPDEIISALLEVINR